MLDLNSAPNGDYINKQKIISSIDDIVLLRHYLGSGIKVGTAISNPTREDKYPSLGLFFSSYHTKRVMYKDFSTGDSGDCFDLLSAYLCINSSELYNLINKDFNLGFLDTKIKSYFTGSVGTYKRDRIEKKSTNIEIVSRRWSNVDIRYWRGKYGLNEKQVNFFNIYPIQEARMGRSIINHSSTTPLYAYIFHKDGEYTYKVYNPYGERVAKWRSNVNASILQGWDQLPKSGDLLILTKSLKDIAVYRSCGYYALSCQSESGYVKPHVFGDLNNRFKKIIIQNDFDLAGVRGTKKMFHMYNLPYFFLQSFSTRDNGCKDISDTREKLGLEKTKEIIELKLKNIL